MRVLAITLEELHWVLFSAKCLILLFLISFRNNFVPPICNSGLRAAVQLTCTVVLKETLSYYVKNKSSVFCTFLDASKAFDRVNYCKLFLLLIQRGLPACFITTLINLYTGHSVRVLCAGISSMVLSREESSVQYCFAYIHCESKKLHPFIFAISLSNQALFW